MGAFVIVPVALETIEVAVLVAVVMEDEEDELKPGRRFLFTLHRARRPLV